MFEKNYSNCHIAISLSYSYAYKYDNGLIFEDFINI